MQGKELIAAYVFLVLLAALVAYAIYRGIYLGPASSN